MLRDGDLGKVFAFFFLLGVGMLFCGSRMSPAAGPTDWPEVTGTARPWTYWWWMGSAVDEPNIASHLARYHEAGIGGVHIIPIYGSKGAEKRFIDYLSPKWMRMLEYCAGQADRLEMGVDMTTGTGWPFGGPVVKAENAAAKVVLQRYELAGGRTVEQLVECKDEKSGRRLALAALMGYSGAGQVIDLTEKLSRDGRLQWEAPAGQWSVYAVFRGWTGQQVKRAAPGGEGSVMDYFSRAALKDYMAWFDRAFASYGTDSVRAFYNDSYEVYGANWTDDFLSQFELRRGYDLRRYLPALFSQGLDDTVARVKSDYRWTIGDLLLEEFSEPWVRWCHARGSLARSQAHGSPGNLLDLYGSADIPETEIFGPSGFAIPGLRTDEQYSNKPPDVLMLKFASSAAHVAGRRLTASESCTWLGEHFQVALSQAKPELDQLMAAGVNHIFYHGMAYSPSDEAWPGWLFYASTNFGPSNSFWRDFPQLNRYVAGCQSFLQAGEPANDILLYFPVSDVWHEKEGMLISLAVHNIDQWLCPGEFYRTAKRLWQRGYTFDYISDRQLGQVRYSSGRLLCADSEYKVIVIPKCRFMPVGTLRRLVQLAEAGATIVASGGLPKDVPGLGDLSQRRREFGDLLEEIASAKRQMEPITQADTGQGLFSMGEVLEPMLDRSGVSRETMVDTEGIEFVRRRWDGGYYYFITNLGSEALDGWVRLGVGAESVVLFEPMRHCRGVAAVRRQKTENADVYLQLKGGQSCVLKTFSRQKVTGPKWRYWREGKVIRPVEGRWEVRFVEGGPVLPAGFETERLECWTKSGGPEAQRFAGTGRYTISFEKPSAGAPAWRLDLGRVCASARVWVNGRYVGTAWCHPFELPVADDVLCEGQNRLVMEVTNLGANRIADMDRRGVKWKKFYDINFVNINYKPFDASGWGSMESGLLGPVRLIGLVEVKPAEGR